jgi:HSP20 family molecular chaperone IbpA
MSNTSRDDVATPATDILERKDGFHIFMDMPGVAAPDLSIDLEENELTITGQSSYAPASDSQNRYVAPEFATSKYQRVFTLSDLVDREKIKATLKDGVLDLFLPKVEAMKPRRITISSGK